MSPSPTDSPKPEFRHSSKRMKQLLVGDANKSRFPAALAWSEAWNDWQRKGQRCRRPGSKYVYFPPARRVSNEQRRRMSTGSYKISAEIDRPPKDGAEGVPYSRMATSWMLHVFFLCPTKEQKLQMPSPQLPCLRIIQGKSRRGSCQWAKSTVHWEFFQVTGPPDFQEGEPGGRLASQCCFNRQQVGRHRQIIERTCPPRLRLSGDGLSCGSSSLDPRELPTTPRVVDIPSPRPCRRVNIVDVIARGKRPEGRPDP